MSRRAIRYRSYRPSRALQLRADLPDRRRVDALVDDLLDADSQFARDVMCAPAFNQTVLPAPLDCAAVFSSPEAD